MKTLTISRASLHVAFLTWVLQERAGETLPHAEVAEKAPHEVAERATAHLWELLEQGAAAAKTGPAS